MYDTICDNEVKAKDSILHHKEGIDLISSNLDLSTIEFYLEIILILFNKYDIYKIVHKKPR